LSLFSFFATFLIIFVMKKTMGIRISHHEELAGIDAVEFGVESYTTFE
jgi:ammonium transporter, Amt family